MNTAHPVNRFSCRCLASLLGMGILLGGGAAANGENWPGWRGPRGDGTSRDTDAPVRWDVPNGEQLLWKTRLPGRGHASPVVWDDHLFIVSCDEQSQDRLLLSLDRKSGRLRWQQVVLRSPLETKHALNSHASSTPATDGETIYVTFLEVDGRTVPAPNVGRPRPVTVGRIVVAAYDFEGRQRWLVRPGEFISAHGFCSSPVVCGDLVIVNGDHDGESYLVALDKRTGESVWRTPRRHKTRSYATPLVRMLAGRNQLLLCGSLCVASFDPQSGAPLWRVEGPTEQFVASLVSDGQSVFCVGGYPTHHVLAIQPDGHGDVTDSHILWHQKNARCYVPSPVISNGFLIVADDRGTANCFDTASGRRLWQERLGNHFSASLVAAGGLVYLQADDGVMTVIRPAEKLEVVSKNPVGEAVFASPAISGGTIFLRGERHLFAIGAGSASNAVTGSSLRLR